MAFPILAGLAAGAGAAAQIFGAGKAAKLQKEAADKALNFQKNQWEKTQKNVHPYIKGGRAAERTLRTGLKPGEEFNTPASITPIDTRANELYTRGTTPIAFSGIDTEAQRVKDIGTTALDFNPITMDQETLQNTPGYQFELQQGLKAVQNDAAARGLGQSGNALRGAAEYTTGLAQKTWKDVYAQLAAERQSQFTAGQVNRETAMNALMAGYGLESQERGSVFGMNAANKAASIQAIMDSYGLSNTEATRIFNMQQADITNRYNRLYQNAALGQSAAVGAGTIGAQTGEQVGQQYTNIGQAGAGAYMAGAGAVSNAANTIGGMAFTNQLMDKYYQPSSSSTTLG